MRNKETLEEFIKKYQKNKTYWNLNEKSDVARNIRIGANWQQEQNKKMFSEEDLKQFAFECVANFLSNNDNQVEIKLVDVIIDRLNNQFKQFKNK
jgi:DUF1680 family protein